MPIANSEQVCKRGNVPDSGSHKDKIWVRWDTDIPAEKAQKQSTGNGERRTRWSCKGGQGWASGVLRGTTSLRQCPVPEGFFKETVNEHVFV